ncbi:RluA family pseudouridine synthase [Achromobacter sp. GG226]|uniref:RluA family pseudouridine synthase n=1 Tax=Verticiella alkaliphila TaxID=2779529 RepID=UPI001C0BD878|nr:RluA family pseudouridine synthase [Verticiella sp. GG226]MBU4612924.1 RluA family pseudouridine synthase [Verticiella sp. GG226]
MVEIGPEHHGQRLDNFLLRLCKGVPKSHLYKAIRGGEVRVNKGRVAVDYRINEGDLVRVPPLRVPQEVPKFVPAGHFPVVYEDDAMLVIDKPSGVAAHGGSGVSFGVIEQLRAARPDARFLELAHRLDRETSGLLMVGKKRTALMGLHDALREGRTTKKYFALVQGDWQNARQHIRLPLLKWTTPSGERRVRVHETGQRAHTIVSGQERLGEFSLVEAELKTGRTHQIRVHLASSGHPLVGDDKYGDDAVRERMARQYGFKRMFLHAHSLALAHPITGEPLAFSAPLPPACEQLLTRLRAARAATSTGKTR